MKLFILLLCLPMLALANDSVNTSPNRSANSAVNTSPEGSWNIIDSETKKVKSMIYVREEDGQLSGIITKLVHADTLYQSPVCEKCKGELKGRGVVGMTVLTGSVKGGEQWVDGKLLDPYNGKEYKIKLKLIDDGAKLELEGAFFYGYEGSPVLGRTLVWDRAGG